MKSRQRMAIGTPLCLLPMVLIALSPLSGGTAFVYMGVLPAFVSLIYGHRIALLTALGTAAGVFVGLLASTSAWTAAGLMGALALGVAWTHSRGFPAVGTYIASKTALVAIGAPRLGWLPEDTPVHTVESALSAAGFVLFGGLWVVTIGAVFMKGMAKEHGPKPVQHIVAFTVMLVVILVLETLVAKLWVGDGTVWWIVLTTLVVVSPDDRYALERAAERAGGTLLGGLVVMLVALAHLDRRAVVAFGVVAALVAGYAYLNSRYWIFTAGLTMALGFLTFPVDNTIRASADRILFTILGALIVVILTIALRWALTRSQRRTSTT